MVNTVFEYMGTTFNLKTLLLSKIEAGAYLTLTGR